jgi:ATP-dependent Lon protease
LDGEQNDTFNDHYLDLDYDLSDVMFITTANTLSGIPVPLQDRMEVIPLSGYTEFEKLNIAVKYLVPRQKKDCGLEKIPVTISESAIRTVIHHYTREAGVRSLERELASVCRKIARQVVNEKKTIDEAKAGEAKAGDAAVATPITLAVTPIEVVAKTVPKYLGVPKYRLGKKEEHDEVGLTNGLSVTSNGGGELLACEVAVVAGKGKLVITGLLEKGMEESAQAAMMYVRSRAAALGLEPDFYQKLDVHVHFPEFIRKDGPSAGVTMATSLASALIKIPVRKDLAMTGEITLRGRVLPIGGLKEKLLAAHRSGISTIVCPRENRKDLREVPRRVLKATRVVLVEHMDEVLRVALATSDPNQLFGPPRETMEYIDGELVIGGSGAKPKAPIPPVTPPGAGSGTGNDPAPAPH